MAPRISDPLFAKGLEAPAAGETDGSSGQPPAPANRQPRRDDSRQDALTRQFQDLLDRDDEAWPADPANHADASRDGQDAPPRRADADPPSAPPQSRSSGDAGRRGQSDASPDKRDSRRDDDAEPAATSPHDRLDAAKPGPAGDPIPAMPPADLLTRGKTPLSAASAQADAAQAEAASTRSAGLADLVREMTERILVSAPQSPTTPEVRIQLRAEHLNGAQLRLFHQDGRLHVAVDPAAEAADPSLNQVLAELQEHLTTHLRHDVAVYVQPSWQGQQASRQADADARHDGRRSAGLAYLFDAWTHKDR